MQYKETPVESTSMVGLSRVGVLRLALSPVMVRRSVLVALVVGTVLNLINQGDVIAAGGAVNWVKVVLTYAIPFCVSTYGACCASHQLRRTGG